MSYFLVFFLHSRTTGVVPASSVLGGSRVGDIAKVRWEGRSYKAKVLFTGHKELCEVKSTSVTTDGELVDDSFEVSSLNVPAASPLQESSRSSSPDWAAERRELISRLTELSESVSLFKDTMLQMNSMVALLVQQQRTTNEMLKELLKRNPAKSSQEAVDYTYANAKSVAELRKIKGPNRNGFALALESMVYKDDTAELEIPVDQRVRSYDRVLFIQRCVFKYYDVPEHLEVDVWKSAKEALNSRVRRRRKALREGNPVPNPRGSDGNDLLDEYDIFE